MPKPVIVDEFQVKLYGDLWTERSVYRFIEDFEHCRFMFGLDDRHRVTMPATDAVEEHHDTSPKDGHIEFAKMWIFKRKRKVLRIRGVQRPTSGHDPNALTVAEYMSALREHMEGLPAFLAEVKKLRRAG